MTEAEDSPGWQRDSVPQVDAATQLSDVATHCSDCGKMIRDRGGAIRMGPAWLGHLGSCSRYGEPPDVTA